MNASTYDRNSLEAATTPNGPSYPNPPKATIQLRSLLACDSFKVQFINTFADHLNTTFLVSNVAAKIDSIKAVLETEMTRHIARWGGRHPPFGSAYLNGMDGWNNYIAVLHYFNINRRSAVRDHILDHFSLSGTYKVTINNPEPERGSVQLNTLSLTDSTWTGDYFNNNPLPLAAVPSPGYMFEKWDGLSTGDSSLVLTTSLDTSFTVRFVEDTSAGIGTDPRFTRKTSLYKNYPDPFNHSTAIRFYLQRSGHVSLRIYSISGALVQELIDRRLSKGEHRYNFSVKNLAHGVYFCRFKAGNYTRINRMIYLR
jgi:hypothetical protein